MIEKISKKIGFTPTEIKVILFFVVIFLVGYFYSEFFKRPIAPEYVEYDYSDQDSLFNYYLNSELEESDNLASKSD